MKKPHNNHSQSDAKNARLLRALGDKRNKISGVPYMISKCFCEATKIEISGTPCWVGYCHCEDCRRATGAPVTAYASFKNNLLTFNSGELSHYESSPGTYWGSCSVCHSPMTYQSKKYPDDTHFHLITIDTYEDLSPDFHVHCSETVCWLNIADDWPKYEGSSPDD